MPGTSPAGRADLTGTCRPAPGGASKARGPDKQAALQCRCRVPRSLDPAACPEDLAIDRDTGGQHREGTASRESSQGRGRAADPAPAGCAWRRRQLSRVPAAGGPAGGLVAKAWPDAAGNLPLRSRREQAGSDRTTLSEEQARPAADGGVRQARRTGPSEGRPRGYAIDSMTLSDGKGRGERPPTRLIGRRSGGRPGRPGRARTGRSACGRARVPHGC